ncbi:MAG: ATP-binding cassette domain-containing protein [Thermodesulfobacteriota bacterium]
MELVVQDLEYIYHRGTPLEVRALHGVSFSLAQGEVLGILGGTGSGKTTLIKNLNGLLFPTAGHVLVDGIDSRECGPELRRRIGLVFQRPERQLFEETVYRDISFVLRRFTSLTETQIRDRVNDACSLIGLDLGEIKDRSPLALSDGEKRKVAIAGILVNDPEIMILDEPAVGLDPPAIADLVRFIEEIKARGNRSVILVSHDIEFFLPVVDRLLVLRNGTAVAWSSPAEVCRDLSNDREMRAWLPGLALLVHDLQEAGYPLKPNGYRVTDLVDQMSRLSGGPN